MPRWCLRPGEYGRLGTPQKYKVKQAISPTLFLRRKCTKVEVAGLAQIFLRSSILAPTWMLEETFCGRACERCNTYEVLQKRGRRGAEISRGLSLQGFVPREQGSLRRDSRPYPRPPSLGYPREISPTQEQVGRVSLVASSRQNLFFLAGRLFPPQKKDHYVGISTIAHTTQESHTLRVPQGSLPQTLNPYQFSRRMVGQGRDKPLEISFSPQPLLKLLKLGLQSLQMGSVAPMKLLI